MKVGEITRMSVKRQPSWRAASLLLSFAACASLLASCTSATAEKESEHSKVSDVMEMKVTPVVEQTLSRNYALPAELKAYQDVAIHPKVAGFIQTIPVHRGSVVKEGQVLATIFAPELDAKVRQAEARVQSQKAALAEANSKLSSAKAATKEGQAKLDADEATHHRLVQAAKTPGVVAENDLDISAKQVEGDNAHISALNDAVQAAKSMVNAQADNLKAAEHELEAVKATENYLVVRAPFSGVITARHVHEGSLVDPNMKDEMLRIQELDRLRLVVPVPEIATSDIEVGKAIEFTVPAYPGKHFVGKIARVGHALDEGTRTMPVELDVANQDRRLDPGMYPEVQWHIERPYATLFVPATAVTTTTERTFLVRVHDGKTQVVDVRRGQPMGDLVEVFGDVHAGDQVAVRASDDMKSGTQVKVELASAVDLAPKKQEGGGE